MSIQMNSSLSANDAVSSQPGRFDTLERLPHSRKQEKLRAPQQSTAPPAAVLDKALNQVFSGREKQLSKTFDMLGASLRKAFAEAPQVGDKQGVDEMREGGLRRIDKDVRKLLKGLGMPPQAAKFFSRNVMQAIRSEDVETVSLSFSSTRTFELQSAQLKQGYAANGEGSDLVGTQLSGFSVAAVQVRSLDISLNLNTGEGSASRSSFESLAVESIQATAWTNSDSGKAPAVEESSETAVPAPTTAVTDAVPEQQRVETETSAVASSAQTEEDVAALVMTDASLLEVRRFVEQSLSMQFGTTDEKGQAEESDGEDDPGGLGQLKELSSRLADFMQSVEDFFETAVNVHDLRIDQEEHGDYLRFTMDALAPIGLTAQDDSGHQDTLFPRPDGSLASLSQEPVDLAI